MENTETKSTDPNSAARALLASVDLTYLLHLWDNTEKRRVSKALIHVRGWIMAELNRRNPEAFNAWLDNSDPGKDHPRYFFNAS